MKRALSLATGWLADRRIPRPLRAPIYRAFARAVGADLSEMRGAPDIHPSFSAFFVRRLVDGARPFPADPAHFPSPCDGRIQSAGTIERGQLLQAKGQSYAASELLAGAASEAELEGACTWTIYLGPPDYHRVHAPLDAALAEVRWVSGLRRSVHPRVLARRARVLSTNERAVLRLEPEGAPRGAVFLVMVGALNVGRIRVQGVAPGADAPRDPPLRFRCGDDLARFEMGSTVVLVAPRGAGLALAPGLASGQRVRLGEPIGTRAV